MAPEATSTTQHIRIRGSTSNEAAAAASASASASASAFIASNLLWVQQGDIPIVISVPHGASPKDSPRAFQWQRKNLPPRIGNSSLAGNMSTFEGRLKRVSIDTGTLSLAKLLSNAIQKATGGRRPHIVGAKFLRKYVDVNRRMEGKSSDLLP
jgi:hypothetical protein